MTKSPKLIRSCCEELSYLEDIKNDNDSRKVHIVHAPSVKKQKGSSSFSKIIKHQSSFSRRNYGQKKKKKRGWTAPRRGNKPRGYNKRGRARF